MPEYRDPGPPIESSMFDWLERRTTATEQQVELLRAASVKADERDLERDRAFDRRLDALKADIQESRAKVSDAIDALPAAVIAGLEAGTWIPPSIKRWHLASLAVLLILIGTLPTREWLEWLFDLVGKVL